MFALETRELRKSYDEKTVVNNVNLKVNEGDIFGFLGKNGAGKSTLINIVTGVINPTSGTFKILGETKIDDDQTKRRIGVLPDYSTFYDELTPLQHLKYFSQIMKIKKTKKELISLLDKVGLKEEANVKTKKFSFGMKKKLGIAQALINDPELIFLDEPTSGVDANSAIIIQDIIKQLCQSGKTIFLTSHNLNEIQKICSQIAIMKEGTIQAQGSMEELRKKYQNSITVHIKHSEINDKQKKLLIPILQKHEINTVWEKNKMIVDVPNDEKIPVITKSLMKLDIDVYRVEIMEKSLEDIFLEL
ncbi:ABC transporter ATP-binding protein [Priestia megaterium]|uniref:ABC transporter ATP-binding protein n=1 Tax=Priestia TaxID=2800373 RepID=UPI001CFA8172|nr:MULTISPECIES: ABC transporter ATP-binding protein [Priestia]MED4219518.1 ABC transporter ATP-binding protein [Priestia megaterium]